MALMDFNNYLTLVPAVLQSPDGRLWSSYDAAGDVLYVHFREPGPATDSELTDNDIILRYDGNEIIGLTILHASRR